MRKFILNIGYNYKFGKYFQCDHKFLITSNRNIYFFNDLGNYRSLYPADTLEFKYGHSMTVTVIIAVSGKHCRNVSGIKYIFFDNFLLRRYCLKVLLIVRARRCVYSEGYSIATNKGCYWPGLPSRKGLNWVDRQCISHTSLSCVIQCSFPALLIIVHHKFPFLLKCCGLGS